MPETTTRVTHKERAERRKAIADYVKENGDVVKAARKFEVSIETARDACKTHNVAIPSNEKRQLPTNSTFRVIADLITTTKNFTQVGLAYGMSCERVSTIYKKCTEAGIPVKKREK